MLVRGLARRVWGPDCQRSAVSQVVQQILLLELTRASSVDEASWRRCGLSRFSKWISSPISSGLLLSVDTQTEVWFLGAPGSCVPFRGYLSSQGGWSWCRHFESLSDPILAQTTSTLPPGSQTWEPDLGTRHLEWTCWRLEASRCQPPSATADVLTRWRWCTCHGRCFRGAQLRPCGNRQWAVSGWLFMPPRNHVSCVPAGCAK